ncbi:MAG: YggS family pyridoxal phosphate-dependent enzyme [Tepidanaerobacteraceae bacterium]|nr:YggS family pyridoxal phosphate-dependent enzyme [Thermoanaerobacterales bacterium]
MDSLECNIANIKTRVKAAAERSGRDFNDINIIAVTKNFPVSIIQKAVDQGIVILGENRVQEAAAKVENVKGDVQWHLIGHLQKNKVKRAVEMFSMIQSVDSISLANEINKRADKLKRVVEILVQINIGRETTKYGIEPEQAISFIKDVSLLSNLKVRGLMTIAPYKENPEEVRVYFRHMREIYENIKNKSFENIDMTYLSMGMSNDFEVAIEEGANMIRIGTGIFGARTK